MSVSTSGFALRSNGSCGAHQVDCGKTIAPYHACCPSGSFCPVQYNDNCCPTAENCTQTLLEDPQCANEGWDLYDNYGYFCCEKGFTGYAMGTTDGCAEPGYSFKAGQVLLSIISAGKEKTPKTSSTTSMSTSTITSSGSASPSSSGAPKSTAETAPKSNTGAIVGGVIGGVGGVILVAVAFWLWWRRRRQVQGTAEQVELSSQGVVLDKYSIAVPLRSEMEGDYGANEANAVPEPKQLATEHGISELE